MKVYEREILDGVGEVVRSSASVALEAKILLDSDYTHPSKEDIQKTIAGFGNSNPDQVDLYYLNSVLVSTGWNKNDDVFDPAEAWAAKDTPVDKQFNYMHNESDIIGHITGSIVVDKNGVKITSEEQPEEFDIITSAVVYKSWSDPELRERMTSLIQEIDEGKWAVSMECLFSDFDYSIISPEGKFSVVARNEESAFLTKHLRVYGGEGKWDGYKVGRLLRNISFSGKGLVNQPANPRSIILDSSQDVFEQETQPLKIKEFIMSDTASVTSPELEAAVASIADLETAKDEKDATIAELNATIEDNASTIAQHVETEKALNTELATVKAELDASKTKLTEAVATIRTLNRTKQATEAGITEDKVENLLQKFDAVDDEAFAAMLELVHAPEATPEVVKEVVAKVVEEEVEEEAVAEELDEVEEEAEAALVDTPEDLTDTFASTASYFRNSVLKTTKNLK